MSGSEWASQGITAVIWEVFFLSEIFEEQRLYFVPFNIEWKELTSYNRWFLSDSCRICRSLIISLLLGRIRIFSVAHCCLEHNPLGYWPMLQARAPHPALELHFVGFWGELLLCSHSWPRTTILLQPPRGWNYRQAVNLYSWKILSYSYLFYVCMWHSHKGRKTTV